VKRVLGIVLLGVGVALAVFAAGLRFYVTPVATNIPYDLESSTTIAEATNGEYLNPGTGRLETGSLRSTTFVVPQPVETNELTGDQAGKVVIWDVYDQITDISSGTVVTASETLGLALDRKTGEVANTGGYSFKLPFGAEKKSYPYWDDTLRANDPINYVGTETVSGLEAYKYESAGFTRYKVAYDEDSLEALRAAFGDGAGDVYYSLKRTIWVEPTTGQFLNVMQSVRVEFKSGEDVTVLLAGDFEYTAETKAAAADTISTNRNLLQLVGMWLPIGTGAAGVILIGVGVFFLMRKPEEESTEAPAEAVAA
jgi:hypothetical protein